jgi:hypothetical protein
MPHALQHRKDTSDRCIRLIAQRLAFQGPDVEPEVPRNFDNIVNVVRVAPLPMQRPAAITPEYTVLVGHQFLEAEYEPAAQHKPRMYSGKNGL